MKPVSTQQGLKTHFIKLKVGVALVMAALFFVLAAAAVAGLIWAGLVVGEGAAVHLRGRTLILGLLLACSFFCAAAIIAWSLLPRIDRFEPPGPALSPSQHPALFAEIARVAARTGQAPPTQVYLVAEPNAFVAQRGGLMGLFSRRVMGVGLALLNVVTVSELRAVLTHEFGHFAGGDTRLGPWLHKARRALVRTVANLQGAADSSANGSGELGLLSAIFSAIKAPFRWYALLYLRMTQSLSRAQEFAADALAVRLEGQAAFINGLARIREAGAVWSVYLEREVLPVLGERALPPLGSGFQSFLGAPRITEALSHLHAEPENEPVDPYDSHPPFAQRVAQARAIAGSQPRSDDRRAIELLSDVPGVEAVLAAAWVEGDVSPVAWSATGELLARNWDESLKESEVLLSGMTPATVPLSDEAMASLAQRRLPAEVLRGLDLDTLPGQVRSVFGLALSALLRRHGFEVHNAPGELLWFVRGGETVQPEVMLGECVAGKLSAEDWRAQWEALGLADRALSA